MAFSRQGVLIILVQLVLLVMAMLLADALAGHVAFIPQFLVRLPEVDYFPRDFRIVATYFVLVHAALFALYSKVYGPWRPADTGRTVQEIFALAIGFAVSALLLFITASIAFDPNLVVGITVLTTVFFIAVHLFFAVRARGKIFASIGALLLGLIKRAFTISGVAIVLFAASPAVMAKLFASDRDFANVITQIRIWFSPAEDVAYGFVNALGGETFRQPMLAQLDPRDPSRLFVLERHGRILAVDYPAGTNRQVMLDISQNVGYVESENGALGFAVHPTMAQPGTAGANQLYLHYTSVLDGVQVNRLSRFTLASDDALANTATEQTLMLLPREPSGFHNGGSVGFGRDGFLYIAVGEGVHPKSTLDQAQTLREGILRIDVDCRGGGASHAIERQPLGGQTGNYCIPSDNPFLGQPGLLGEYWALGLRNPFRFSFDVTTDALWVGDVGSTEWEEVNLVRAGHHYQYPFIEGHSPGRKPRPEVVFGREEGPRYTYLHTAYDRAVIGGFVYQGNEFPALNRQYLFADNYSSKVFSMPATGDTVDTVEHIATANQFAQRGTSSLTQLANGDVVLTTLGRSTAATGEVLRLTGDVDAAVVTPVTGPENETWSAAEIRENYVTNCSRCHGSAGDGLGPDAALLQISLPDFTTAEFQAGVSDDDLRRVIVEGGVGVGLSPMMPAWGHLLSEAEVDGMIKLLRDFHQPEQ